MLPVVSCIVTFAVGTIGAAVLTPLARTAALRYEIVDHGNVARKRHDRPVPLLGGVAIAAVLIPVVTLGGWLDAWEIGPNAGSIGFAMLSSTFILCLVGLFDDIRELSVSWKLVGQLAGVAPAVWCLPHATHVEVFGTSVQLGAWGQLMVAGWLLAGINAMNFLDGADGVASSVGTVIALTCSLVAALTGHADVAVLSALLAGALIGFLRYNVPPATVFLGDAGSMTIGFWLAALTLEAVVLPDGGRVAVAAIALLAIPLYDLALAVARRLLERRRIWHPDRGHVHHRLLDRGFTPWQTVAVLAGLSTMTCGAALIAVVWGRELLAILALLAMMTGMAFAHLVGYEESKLVANHLSRWLQGRRPVQGRSQHDTRRHVRGSRQLPPDAPADSRPLNGHEHDDARSDVDKAA